MFPVLKALLPNKAVPVTVLRGPFRGARIRLNPRDSLRKIFGIYEHELNGWLSRVIPQVDTVLDVGANDGYFTFGCAAAFRRLRKEANVISFEPDAEHYEELRATLKNQPDDRIRFDILKYFVGREEDSRTMTLDDVARGKPELVNGHRALIKIDVEGAELDVVAGALSWLRPTNYFLIEVHDQSYLAVLEEQFSKHRIRLRQVNQQALPLIGRETRSESNWWLVSELP